MGFSAAFARYSMLLDAVTIPVESGRRIIDHMGSQSLSKAANDLYRAMQIEFWLCLSKNSKPVPSPVNVQLCQSDSLEGPWEEVQAAERASYAPTCAKDSPEFLLLTAIQRAMKISGFTPERWNELQAVCPGGDHARYRAGDVITTEEIEILGSVDRLLKIAGTVTRVNSAGAKHRAPRNNGSSVKLINLKFPQSTQSDVAPRHAPSTSGEGSGPPAPDRLSAARCIRLKEGTEVDPEGFAVRAGTRTCVFGRRCGLLMSLLVRLAKNEGRPVFYDQLKAIGGPWSERTVSDQTVRGALSRIRSRLKDSRMVQLASAIKSGTFDRKPYAILNLDVDSLTS